MVVLLVTAGCASTNYVSVRKMPDSPLIERLQLASRRGPRPSPRTVQLLRRYGLKDAVGDPERAMDRVSAYVREEPTTEGYYAITELAYIAARHRELHDESKALDLYGASVAYAYQYLFDPNVGYLRNPYDPQFRGACDLYNGALEGSLRILARNHALVAGATQHIKAAGRQWVVEIVGRGNRWRAEDFGEFKFTSDFEVHGLPNHYRTYGLGVPLVGVHRQQEDGRSEEKFYPPGMSLPVTAFLSVVPTPEKDRLSGATVHHCVLELYDTLNSTDTVVDGRRVPLESDLTTPLAYFLDRAGMDQLSLSGLLRPGEVQKYTGLYMVQPYEPDKIPVLFVHGLYSSPITWIEMLNDLQAQADLREHYQFWFYLYPTGQPFWISAAQMRVDLVKMRQELDPQHRRPALDQMVLVGHSLGGLVARMQTVSSGNNFWKLATDQPFQMVKADADVRERLAQAFFFQPNPSIRRVITIATPYRGSQASNSATQWLAQRLIRMPSVLLTRQQQLFKKNPGLFPRNSLLESANSIESLSPHSPILPVLLGAPTAPWVKFNNIVGVAKHPSALTRLNFTARGDGVVAFDSAHLDNVQSELVVDADHMTVHRNPLAVLEVRRILHQHLEELRSFPQPPAPRMWTAQAKQRFAPPPVPRVPAGFQPAGIRRMPPLGTRKPSGGTSFDRRASAARQPSVGTPPDRVSTGNFAPRGPVPATRSEVGWPTAPALHAPAPSATH